MANQTGPATKLRRSTRATRQARKNEAIQVDETDEDTKVADPPKKRRRVAKRDAATKKESQVVTSKVRRRTGKLSNLLDMPIDILYEVFSQLDPSDILKLTRTNKDLRNLLLNKSAVSVWKETLRNVPGLPDCPTDMSIPAYTNLLFSMHCHICSAYTRSVEWRFRMRICKKCSKDDIDALDFLFNDNMQAFRGLNHSQLCAIIPHRRDKRGMFLYSQSQFQIISDEYSLLKGEDAKKQFLADRTALVLAIHEHAGACEVWERNRTDSRHQDLSALKKERLAAIVRRLEDLGWGEEVKSIRRPDSLADHKSVNRPQRLTDKIWSNIKDPILQYMEQMRGKRLEREFQALIRQRKGPAIEAMREYKKSKLGDSEFLPGPQDYCAFGPIQDILKKPVDIEITSSSFDSVIPLLPGLISQWREQLDLKMVKRTGVKYWNSASAPRRRSFYHSSWTFSDSDLESSSDVFPRRQEPQLSDNEAMEKLKLASAVFSCRICSSPQREYVGFFMKRIPQASKIMFYPQVLAHHCNSLHSDRWSYFHAEHVMGNNEPDPLVLMGSSGSLLRKPWDCSDIFFNHQGKTVAEAIIKIAGLDPKKAKSQEMDDLNVKFICTTCFNAEEEKLPDPTLVEDPEPEEYEDLRVNIGLFDWRGAVRHHLDRHSAHEVEFSTMKSDDISDEIKAAEQQLRERTTDEWQCVHCMDTRNEKGLNKLQAIKEHLITDHEIDSPVLNEDYYRHFSAPDQHLFQRPLWVSYKMHDPCGELSLIPSYTQRIKGDDGTYVKNADGTFKQEVIDHDKYDFLRPRISDVDQYNTLLSLDVGITFHDWDDWESGSDSDMDGFW